MSLNIQNFFTNTKLTAKSLNNIEKETKCDILNNVVFYDMKHAKGLISARMKDALHNLPIAIAIILNPLSSEFENIEGSYEEISDLEGQEKIIIPSNILIFVLDVNSY